MISLLNFIDENDYCINIEGNVNLIRLEYFREINRFLKL